MGTAGVRRGQKVLEMVVMVAQHCKCDQCHRLAHLKVAKMANCMLYIFYHNFF